MRIFTSFLTLLTAIAAMPALAQSGLETIGKPVDRATGFQTRLDGTCPRPAMA